MSLTLHANKLIKNMISLYKNKHNIRIYEHLTKQDQKGNLWNLFIYDIKNRIIIQCYRECLFEKGLNSDYRLQNTFTLQQFKETWFGKYTIHYLI
jgi:hypothetical protein